MKDVASNAVVGVVPPYYAKEEVPSLVADLASDRHLAVNSKITAVVASPLATRTLVKTAGSIPVC